MEVSINVLTFADTAFLLSTPELVEPKVVVFTSISSLFTIIDTYKIQAFVRMSVYVINYILYTTLI